MYCLRKCHCALSLYETLPFELVSQRYEYILVRFYSQALVTLYEIKYGRIGVYEEAELNRVIYKG